jgi:murein L,D-transpeptidase YcbB/YkuD
MNRVFGKFVVIGLATAGLATAGIAYAQGFGHGHGHGHDGLVPLIVHQYVTHDQIQAVYEANGATLKSDFSAVKAARQQLETDLIAGNSSAVQTDVQTLESAQSTLLQEKVTIAEAILANLSSTQRTQVGNFVTAYRTLQQQDAASRKALFQQYGIGWGGASSSNSSSSESAE